jgi:hypothetical protein
MDVSVPPVYRPAIAGVGAVLIWMFGSMLMNLLKEALPPDSAPRLSSGIIALIALLLTPLALFIANFLTRHESGRFLEVYAYAVCGLVLWIGLTTFAIKSGMLGVGTGTTAAAVSVTLLGIGLASREQRGRPQEQESVEIV